ncbi:beta-CASP ribonuclease aCPSF1 [Methanococcoides alaskense]|uniref:Transcription termination factor FttA n=1 Tax=Methanococcoides alaskense TaxID=325778 RepID=A0AA90U188_9EURY|nr:beta-CASP ribonuclease aCPSF1 [Methanococcoides alaskense]MDA0525791.1 beta-CASP ribonuclease aCPSF1 [Methanococcoides alaskense]MDR6223995.1 KH/beta-lactamase-domain protein [Methanococcoides alaskense]
MAIEDVLADLKKKIEEKVPDNTTITSVEFEGPQLVVYTEDPKDFADNGQIVRTLAKTLRTRIVVRPDPKVLVSPEEAIGKIKDTVPKDAVLSNFHFDPDVGEVVIEAEKPGLVIGKHGETLREITKKIGWTPKVVRTPPIKSRTVKNIREFMRTNHKDRKEILKAVGRNIHRECTSKDHWVRVTSLGGCKEVGRSCFLLSTPESKIMIDCGVNVGSDDNMTPYLYLPEVQPLNQIDAVVITHAHLDHQGLVPLLYKYGYEGPIYCTSPTRDIMTLLQLDFIDVAAKEGKKPPYESTNVRDALKHTIALDYEEVTDIAPDVKLTFHNAGHIIGSAISHFHIGDGLHNVVVTGDYKYGPTRLFDPAVNKFPRVETVITESTYGASSAVQPSLKEAEKNLQQIIKSTLDNKGIVLIPAFAVGRSQEVMIVLEDAIRRGIIDDVPVYLDGMIWEATAIHATYPEYLNNNLRKLIFQKGQNPFLAECFKPVDSNELRKKIIEDPHPCVILSTSGMMNAGPVMEYFKAFAPDPNNTLVFVGYQADGTLGRRIQKGWKEIPVSSKNGTEVVKMNMGVEVVDGFSGHSDRKQLMEYFKKMKPQPERVFTEHGDERSCIDLASSLHKKYRLETRALTNLETIRLV